VETRLGQFVATLKPRSRGFAHPVDLALSRNGRPFVQLVLEALGSNRITAVDAARYIDLKYEHFEKLRDTMIVGPGGAPSMNSTPSKQIYVFDTSALMEWQARYYPTDILPRCWQGRRADRGASASGSKAGRRGIGGCGHGRTGGMGKSQTGSVCVARRGNCGDSSYPEPVPGLRDPKAEFEEPTPM